MAKLIIDEAAMNLAMAKLAGSPIFAGPDGNLLAPRIIDLVEGDDERQAWQPANALSQHIVLGGEACRDILFHTPAAVEPRTRRRALKALTVPVCSLMDVVEAVRRELNAEGPRRFREEWPAQDRATYTSVGRRLRKTRLNGPVRKVRHKLGAHLDPDAFNTANLKLDPNDLLGAMGDALVLLMLSMNHPSSYFSWIRCLGQVGPDAEVVETMFSYPACVRWVVDPDGRVTDVLPVRLAEDPRRQIQPDVYAAIAAYNELVEKTGSTLSTMRAIPADELRKEQGDTTEEPRPDEG